MASSLWLIASAVAAVAAYASATETWHRIIDPLNALLQSAGVSQQQLYGLIVAFIGLAYMWNYLHEPHVPLVVTDLRPRLPADYPKRVSTSALHGKNNTINCYEPATMYALGEVPVTDAEGVKNVVAKARAAQKLWAKTTFKQRKHVLKMMKKAILHHADAIVKLSCMDTGKPRMDAQFGEVLSSAGKLDWVISCGDAVLAPEVRSVNLTSLHKSARVEYSALGVIGVIAPWNYPFYNMLNHTASGLFAGNAVVIKISEYSAWSACHFITLLQDVVAAAGYPRDLVQLVSGFGDAGAALVGAVDKVIFTGSPGIGKAVMAGAAKTLTPLVLELGGKDPFIVCDDANVDAAVTLALRGSYQNSGQNCVGIERIYVYEKIYAQFVDAAAAAVRNLRTGSPIDPTGKWNLVDMGPLTTAPQLALIEELVNDAVKKGARLLVGGRSRYVPVESKSKPSDDPLATGLFFEPTVLADVTHDMRIANEEVFGPVMTIFKVAGNDDAKAIAMANSTEYGLGGTVFSASPARANAIAASLHCGMVGVNAYGLNYLVQSLPFGGVRASGFDRFAGPEGLRACCLLKSVVTDWSTWFSIPTPVPAPLRYPVAASASEFTKNLIEMQFADSLWARVKAMLSLAKA